MDGRTDGTGHICMVAMDHSNMYSNEWDSHYSCSWAEAGGGGGSPDVILNQQAGLETEGGLHKKMRLRMK